ncbi:DsbC family protein [Ramlibacter sp. G-1-2-2]|uniref:Thiol:disulfide interchange protein n=2 Tax=Ramlibacter agri TaxID=2728837 RepID=A0A848H7B8_9BURK|nr:DsbC family protein [Ramlibacter agri]
MKRRFLLTSLAASAALLAACKDSTPPGGAAGPATAPAPAAAAGSTPVTIEAIQAEGKGFSVGSEMAARTVYVFFDAQCPHCAALWESARPLKSQARFVWMPVGVLNEKSTLEGAAILAAPDPVAAMDQHEASMHAGTGGIAAGTGQDAQKDAIKKNTELMTKFGFGSVPTIVAKHATTGEVVTVEGALPTAALAAKLGLQAPAS